VAIGQRWKPGISTPGEFYARRIGGNQEVGRVASFGWLKTIALLRKVRHRGIHKVGWVFTFAAAAYNLVRMRNLLSPTVQTA
jgi:hypothetical protein